MIRPSSLAWLDPIATTEALSLSCNISASAPIRAPYTTSDNALVRAIGSGHSRLETEFSPGTVFRGL